MDRCILCDRTDDLGLEALSGLRICPTCRHTDPAVALARQGIRAEWRTSLLGVPVVGSSIRFGAELDLGRDLGFTLLCIPEMLSHTVVKLLRAEIQVGDPAFDRAIYLRTSSTDLARSLLAREGVQSALLALLGGVRKNSPGMKQVLLEGSRIQVRVEKLDALDEGDHQELKLETAALALHAVSWLAADGS